MQSELHFAIIRRLNTVIFSGNSRFGMPWRTFSGYINGYSDLQKIVIPAKEKINWHIKKIRKFNKPINVRTYFSALELLIMP